MSGNLAIIIITYQNYQMTEDFVACFFKQSVASFKIFNTDCSTNYINKHYPSYVETIRTQNKGYSHGVNVAINTARNQGYRYFVIINNDTRVDSNFVKSVLSAIMRHSGCILGGKIYYESGFEYHQSRYTKKDLGKVIWYAGGNVDWNHALTPHRGVDEVDVGAYDKFEETSFVNGCLMMYDDAVIQQVGEWDEKYFLYFEDADYCERAKKAGVKLYYDPSVVIWHKISQSSGGSGSLLQKKYQEKNRIRFCLKYGPFRTSFHLIKNYTIEMLKSYIHI